MSEDILRKLETSAIDSLVGLVMDHLLGQPVASLVEPPTMAQQIVLGLQQSLQSEQMETNIKAHLDRIRTMTPEGTLRERIPPEVIEPIRDIVARPVQLNRAMVGRVVEHGAIEDLLREILVSALQGFAQRIRPNVPAGRAGNRLRSLKKVGEGMLGGIGAEIERQAEQKVKEFVDGILSSAVSQAADELCNPSKAETFGTFRGHILDQLLDTPITELMAEAEKVDPEALLASTTATLRAIGERDSITEDIEQIIRTTLDSFEGKSLGELLDEAGIAATWRDDVEKHVNFIAKDFIATAGFKNWLEELVNP